jgi:ADP-ribosylation factor related protein 1
MYTLLTGLYRQYTQKEEFNIIILGLDNAGKTTLLERIKHIFLGSGLDPSRIAPTVGLNIGKVDIGSHRLNFWDLGGMRSFPS